MKRRVIVVMLVAVLAAGGIVAWRQTRGNGAAPASQWRTATVTRGDLTVSVTGSGSISPASQVEVKSRATGTVQAVYVSEGDRVAKGQILVRLRDPDSEAAVAEARASLRSAQARLTQAQADRTSQRAQTATQIRQAEASLAAAQARLREVESGARPEEIAQAEASVRAAASDLELARLNHTRNEQLFAQGFIARQAVDQTAAQLRSAEEQYRIAQEKLRLAKAGSTTAEIDQARAAVRQAEATLAQARARTLDDQVQAQDVVSARASVAQAQTTLANAQSRLAETEIRAPVAGLVSNRSVEVGQTVIGGTSGTSVITLAVVEPLLARIMVDESDIAAVRPGLAATITADALEGQTFKGQVQAVSPGSTVNNNVVQYEVTARLTGPTAGLRLGMTVDAELILMQRRNVLLVPRQAVRGTESKVVLIAANGALTPAAVQAGSTDDRMVEIVSGLREGQVVYLGDAASASSQSSNGTATTRQTNPFLPTPPPGPPPGR